MSPLPVHVSLEGFGEGGQAEAEFTSRYVIIAREEHVETGAGEDTGRSTSYRGNIYRGLTNLDIVALTMTDVPKKNKKGKRVA